MAEHIRSDNNSYAMHRGHVFARGTRGEAADNRESGREADRKLAFPIDDSQPEEPSNIPVIISEYGFLVGIDSDHSDALALQLGRFEKSSTILKGTRVNWERSATTRKRFIFTANRRTKRAGRIHSRIFGDAIELVAIKPSPVDY